MKRKICAVITARPSYARIKTVLESVRNHPNLELQLVVGASAILERYGPVIKVIESDGFKPDAVVYMVVEGENLVPTAKSTGLGVVELATIFGDQNIGLAVVSMTNKIGSRRLAVSDNGQESQHVLLGEGHPIDLYAVFDGLFEKHACERHFVAAAPPTYI